MPAIDACHRGKDVGTWDDVRKLNCFMNVRIVVHLSINVKPESRKSVNL